MSTVYDYDEEGNRFVKFDSRWRFPHLLGFTPEDPEYAELQQMWEEATGKTIPDNEKPGGEGFQTQPVLTWTVVNERRQQHEEHQETANPFDFPPTLVDATTRIPQQKRSIQIPPENHEENNDVFPED